MMSVIEGHEDTILWDFTIHIDSHIKTIRSDKYYKQNYLLIDIGVLLEKWSVKEYNKISKYNNWKKNVTP